MIKNNFNILFLYSSPKLDNSSYAFRIDKFAEYFSNNNFTTKSIYLKDCTFNTPSLIFPMNIPFLLKLLRRFDIVHAGNTPCAYFMKISSKFKKQKYIYDVHGDFIQEALLDINRYSLFDNFLLFQSSAMEYLASRSDYFVVCSEPLKQRYIDLGIEPDNIEVIRNGVDVNLFKPFEPEDVCDLESERFVVTYAGGFQKWQGIENLLDAAKIIREYSEISIRIIGFKESDSSFKQKIVNELGNMVQVIDALPRKGLISYLNTSDILIIPRDDHPAINAAFPTKFAEYIAIGKPVIVTRVDETANLVKKYDCGFVCDPNSQSIAETILLAKNLSRDKLVRKGKNARLLAESMFDQNVINENYYNFISDILLK